MKTGLVIEGGGMKCAFTAGIIDQLIEDRVKADYVIGVSAGASIAGSYLLGHKGEDMRGFLEVAASKSAMGIGTFLKNGAFFNLDEIYGSDASREQYEQLMADPAQITIVATKEATGQPHYFTKADFSPDNLDVLAASSAIPVLSHHVNVAGKYYYDGGCADPLPVKKALEDGCDRLIIVLCRPADFVMKPQGWRWAYHFMLRKFPGLIRSIDQRHETYNQSMRLAHRLQQEGKAFIFSSPCPTDSLTYTSDAGKLQDLYDLAVKTYGEKREHLHQIFPKQQV